MKVVLAFDLGTTGNRVVAYSKNGDMIASSACEFPQIFPRPGWVEHNPFDILNTTFKAAGDVIAKVGIENIECVGITNQRETAVLWDSETGEPVCNAIVWQCRRTRQICDELKSHSKEIRSKTGLFLDPYFSATKIKWILENIPGAKTLAKSGRLLFGTVDTWLLWNLTGKKIHATDPSNASRTLCFNIHDNKFDDGLLGLFGVPKNILPEVRESAGDFGAIDKKIFGRELPITAVLGDQQASLFAQVGLVKGGVKNTYGTGLFLMMMCGEKPVESKNLITTVAWRLDGKTYYALEGSVFVGGSALQWLRDGLQIIKDASDSEGLGLKVPSNEGVYFVPALQGLGAPYWKPDARGIIVGLTRGTRREHIVRAALEAIAYQTRDVVQEMDEIEGVSVKRLTVDGGAAKNNFLMQFQSDILGIPVERVANTEMTALGVAGMSGIYAGFWTNSEFEKVKKIDKVFEPKMKANLREQYYREWKNTVSSLIT